MSGPYRFTQEPAKSPLERIQSPVSDGQPVSFKTNVNRMKTKKWVEAKKNAYDGDDWGEYDEYDEYGTENAPPPQPAIPPGPRGYGQRFDQPGRSFTDPRQAGPPQTGRRNSFETGDEHRAFSASMVQPPHQYGQPQQQYGQPPYGAPRALPEQVHPALRQSSGAESDVSDTPQHRRDFSPAALPSPLHTRIYPAPIASSPQNTQFPSRKSSISQVESPAATSPRGRTPSNPGKPLPFVRPADIYKRYEEGKQRASLESSRPSLDSLLDTTSSHVQAHPQESLEPLETVAERKSEYIPDSNLGKQAQEKPLSNPESSQSFLPPVPVEGISDFGSDMWSSGPQSSSHALRVSQSDEQNLRNMVDQAFTRKDESRSVPPTPISKSDSGVSRSNTDSTTGVSPIMSRVPSSATSALKARNQAIGDNSTPVIVEESSDTGTPISRPTSMANALGAQVPRKPSPSHSRHASNTSLPHNGLSTPTSVESPARSPAIEPQKRLPEPEVAQLSAPNPSPPNSPLSDASTREADIASVLNKSSDPSGAQFGAAEKESQMAFLESHQAQSSIADALPRSRSESPSKGRVHELAGKFGDVSHSRRGSAQSIASRTSVQSWEKSQDNSRPTSPSKANATTKDNLAGRPIAGREASFRPKLPGQWESYATSAATPSEHDKELGTEKINVADDPASLSLETADITPTTQRFPTSSAEPATSDSPMALSGLPYGDAMPRPLYVDRTSSTVSTIPPTPPAKDTPQFEDLPPPPAPLKQKEQLPESRRSSAVPTGVERPSIVPQLSTDPSAEDDESDRLRKEIVAQLTPKRSFATPAVDAAQSPSPTRPLEDSSEAAKPVTDAPDAPDAPSLLTRFSWEGGSSQPQGPAQTESNREVVEEAKLPSPAVEEAANKHPHDSYEDLPEPYFGPGHSAATTHAETEATGVKDETRAPTPPPVASNPLGSPVSPPSGLHVVNSADHPEAIEMPYRLSAQVSPISDLAGTSEDKPTAVEDAKVPESPKAVTQTPPPTAGAGAVQPPVAKSPVSDKPLGFRDIVNIKSSSERINIYNQTREYWAHADHGLNDWVSSAVSANPALVTDPYSQPRPVMAGSTSSRHRATGSISIPLFGKHLGSQQAGPSGASASQTPTTPTASPMQSGLGRTASHQMQSKGKDFMHTAGVLSGKGLTGAKGLFAKGKSRFKNDKVDK